MTLFEHLIFLAIVAAALALTAVYAHSWRAVARALAGVQGEAQDVDAAVAAGAGARAGGER